MRSPAFELYIPDSNHRHYDRGADTSSSIASSLTCVSSSGSSSLFPITMTGSHDELPSPNPSLIRDDLPPIDSPTFAASLRYESDLASYHHSRLWAILDADAEASQMAQPPTRPPTPMPSSTLLPSLMSKAKAAPERDSVVKSRHTRSVATVPEESPELSLVTEVEHARQSSITSWLSMFLVPVRGRSLRRRTHGSGSNRA